MLTDQLSAGIVAAVVLVACAGGAVLLHQRDAARVDASTARAELSTNRAAAAAAVADAQRLARAEEQRRTAALEEITHAHDLQVAQLRDDAARAADAVRRLRERLTMLSSTASSRAADPGLAGNGTTAGDLAELLGACSERYRAVAAAADEHRAAGLACEQSFDAVRGQ